jgi:hypothetical protein
LSALIDDSRIRGRGNAILLCQVIPGFDHGHDLLQRTPMGRVNVLQLLPMKLACERMVSKHFANPSRKVAPA